MQQQLKGSWRKHMDYRYLAAEDFEQPAILTIKAVIKDEVYNPKNRKKEPCTALQFIETPKLMVLKPGKARIISKLAGTSYIERWPGLKIICEQHILPTAFGKKNVPSIKIKMQKVKA